MTVDDDVSAWSRLQEERDRLLLLADASARLGSSLDYEKTLQSMTDAVVPSLADWCVVHLQDEDGAVRRVAVRHPDPDKIDLVRRLEERYPYDPAAPSGVAQVLRTGESQLVPGVSEGFIEEATDDEELRVIMRAFGFTSWMVLPLIARERILGALTLVSAESGRHYSRDDLELAGVLAARAALAVDHARLYGETQQLAAQQSAMLAQMTAMEQQKQAFLSAAAHDLRSPLTGVKGLTQLLRRRMMGDRPLDRERVGADLLRIERSADRMNSIIGELLDVSRLEAGEALQLALRPIDLVGLVRQRIAEASEGEEPSRIGLHVSSPALWGEWDGDRLERVLTNLLSNALKYSADDSPVVVCIGSEEREGTDWAIVSVEDAGIGIPSADLPHVFERFHRGRNVGGETTGAGIGLAGSKQIVEQHGGRIEVESTEGQGSRFTVRLPVRPTPGTGGRDAGQRISGHTSEG